MSKTIQGKILEVKTEEATLPAGKGSLLQHNIKIEHDGTTTTVRTWTGLNFPLKFKEGQEVEASFEAKTTQGRNGNFTFNKLLKDGLKLVGSESKIEAPKALIKAAPKLSLPAGNKGFDPEGAREGNAISNAVQMLIRNAGIGGGSAPRLGMDNAEELSELINLVFTATDLAKQKRTKG